MTELEMRDAECPTPDTVEQLSAYVTELAEQEHDYGTCVYAMSMAATASFNYMARKLGVTGFQAGCADMDVLRRTRRLEGPFALVDGANMLYPQHDLVATLRENLESWEEWAAGEARKLIAEDTEGQAHPNVRKHWENLAAKHPEESSDAATTQ